MRPEQLADWEKLYSAGTQAQAAGRFAGRFAEAASDYRKAGEIDDGFAQLTFQRASCELELGQSLPAEDDFRLARDLDALRFRADSRINDIIRQTANAKGIPLIGAAEEFARYGGEDLFYDHVHLNFTGNYHLALLFAAKIEKHWPGEQANSLPWLTEAEVARRLAYTGFDERRVGEEMRARLQPPPFNAQSNFRARDERWRMALAALATAPASYISNYQAAVELAPLPVILPKLYGYDMGFDTYLLSFLDSDVWQSRTDGQIRFTNQPAGFTTEFERMLFSCHGALLSAQLPASEGVKHLNYWNVDFTPLSLDLVPSGNDTCGTSNRWLVLGVETKLPFIPQALHASLGFWPDGNLVTAHRQRSAPRPRPGRGRMKNSGDPLALL